MQRITKVSLSPSLSKNIRNIIRGRTQLPTAVQTKKLSGTSEEWTDVLKLSDSNEEWEDPKIHSEEGSNEEWDDTETHMREESDYTSEDGYSPVEQLRCAEFSRSDRLVYPSSKFLLDFDSDEFENLPVAASTRIFPEATFSEGEIDIPLQIPTETESCSPVEFSIRTPRKKFSTSNVSSRSSCTISGSSKECSSLKVNSGSSCNIDGSSTECGTSNAYSGSSRNIGGSSKDCGTSNANSGGSRKIGGSSEEHGTSNVGFENSLNGSVVERDLQDDNASRTNSFIKSIKKSKIKLRNIQRRGQDSRFNPNLHNTMLRSFKDISNHKLPERILVTDWKNTSALEIAKSKNVLPASTKKDKRSQICCLTNNQFGFQPNKFMKPSYRSDVPIDDICLLK